MKKLLMVIPLTIMLASCGVNESKAVRVLEAQGMTNVRITGYSWFGCTKGDNFSSNFTATGANGKPISGSVCSGLLKSMTVRFD